MGTINSIEELMQLSDEELSRVDVDSLSEAPESDENDEGGEEAALDTENEDSGVEEDEETEDEPEEDESDVEESEEDSGSEEESDDATEDESDDESDNEDEASTPESELVEKILNQPIRANGRDIKIKDADEAVRMIQMGFGMQEKARKMKPYMRYIKTLENAQLLDENKINFAIDLLNGDKDAIVKLMKDSKIDPLDFDSEENPESNYVPKNHSVPESRVQFDEQLDLISSSPKKQDTLEYVRSLDDDSFNLIKKDPRAIGTINNLMENGYHDKIQAELDKSQLLGDPLISGKSDLEAYLLIGMKLDKEGAFTNDPAPTKANTPSQSKSTPNKQKKADAKQKRAASSNPGAAKAPKPKKEELELEDYFNMSDEDFLKSL